MKMYSDQIYCVIPVSGFQPLFYFSRSAVTSENYYIFWRGIYVFFCTTVNCENWKKKKWLTVGVSYSTRDSCCSVATGRWVHRQKPCYDIPPFYLLFTVIRNESKNTVGCGQTAYLHFSVCRSVAYVLGLCIKFVWYFCFLSKRLIAREFQTEVL